MSQKINREYLLKLPKVWEEQERRMRLSPIIRWARQTVEQDALLSKKSVEVHITYIEDIRKNRQYHPQIDSDGKYQACMQQRDAGHLINELSKIFEGVLLMLEGDILTIDWS
jgi:hypothetical protein